jgi:hypothetical protein
VDSGISSRQLILGVVGLTAYVAFLMFLLARMAI